MTEEQVLAELTGSLAPRIQVVSLLGRGGMALVFLGRDPLLERSIAIKVLAPEFAGSDVVTSTFEVGGPEVLSWNDVVALFGKVLGKRVRAMYAPAAVFRAQQMLLSPFSPAAGNLMGMNWLVGSVDTAYDISALTPKFGITLTTSEQFLRQKLALAE